MIDAGQLMNILIIGSAFGLVLSLWLMIVLAWVWRRKSRESKIGARLGTQPASLWEHAEMSASATQAAGAERSRPTRRRSGIAPSDRLVTRTSRILASIALPILAFGAGLALTSSTLLGSGFAVAAFVAVQIFFGQRAKKRTLLFEQQLVDALELASRSLRAGHPLTSAFQLISTEMDRPVSDVFAAVCQQHAMGADLDRALSAAAARSDSPDLRLLSTSISIQSRTGGNVAQLMDRIAVVIRERIRLGRRLRVLTAQTQLSKRVLIALPVVVFFVFGLINREYMDPFYATMAGRIMLAAAIALLALGSWVMNRMTALKY